MLDRVPYHASLTVFGDRYAMFPACVFRISLPGGISYSLLGQPFLLYFHHLLAHLVSRKLEDLFRMVQVRGACYEANVVC